MMRFIPLAFYLPTLVIIPASLLAPELGLIEAAGGGGGVSEMMRRMKLEEAATLSSYGYLLTQFTVIATYLGLFLFPAGQRFDYDYPLYTTLFEPAVLVSLLMLLSLSAVAVFVGLRRGRWHSPGLLLVPFGVLWFFLTLSVESSVVPIRDVIFEHRCYLPSIGLFTATSVLLVGAARRRRSVTVLIVLMLVSLSVTTHLRNRVWADDLALYTDEVLKTPGEASPHNYLAMAYGSRGMLKEAAVEYRKALKIDPGFHAARNNLALALMSMGDLGGAAREFSVLAKERSTYAGAHYNLGLIYMEEGMKAKAREALERAKSLDPRNPDIERVLNALDPA